MASGAAAQDSHSCVEVLNQRLLPRLSRRRGRHRKGAATTSNRDEAVKTYSPLSETLLYTEIVGPKRLSGDNSVVCAPRGARPR